MGTSEWGFFLRSFPHVMIVVPLLGRVVKYALDGTVELHAETPTSAVPTR